MFSVISVCLCANLFFDGEEMEVTEPSMFNVVEEGGESWDM